MIKRISHINPWKCGFCLAAVHGCLAVGAVLLFFVLSWLNLLPGAHGTFTVWPYSVPVTGSNTALPGGPFAVVVLPLASALYGLLVGIVVAVAYNWVARWTGGIQVTLADVSTTQPPFTSQPSA